MFYSVLSDIQISCTTIVLHRQIHLVGRGGIEPPLSDFQSDALTNFATFPIVRFDKENAQTHLGLYIMSLLKFLQDYLWQCSNTRYYFGLSFTLTEPKINFNLDTLPNPFIYFFLWVPYWSWTNLNGFADRYLTARSREQKMSATNDRRTSHRLWWSAEALLSVAHHTTKTFNVAHSRIELLFWEWKSHVLTDRRTGHIS